MIMSSLFAYSSSFASIQKVLLYGTQCEQESWQFTPPLSAFDAGKLADCVATSFLLMAWVPKHQHCTNTKD